MAVGFGHDLIPVDAFGADGQFTSKQHVTQKGEQRLIFFAQIHLFYTCLVETYSIRIYVLPWNFSSKNICKANIRPPRRPC